MVMLYRHVPHMPDVPVATANWQGLSGSLDPQCRSSGTCTGLKLAVFPALQRAGIGAIAYAPLQLLADLSVSRRLHDMVAVNMATWIA